MVHHVEETSSGIVVKDTNKNGLFCLYMGQYNVW